MQTTPNSELLDWSHEPGFHERRLLTRHNNVFFPNERRGVSRADLEAAKTGDQEMYTAFAFAAATANAALDLVSPEGVTGGVLNELNETITHGCAIGARAEDLVAALHARGAVIVEWLVKNVLEKGTEEEKTRLTDWLNNVAALYRVVRNQAYIDWSRGEEADRLPALLSTDASNLRCMFQELPPDLADLAGAMRDLRRQLQSFALRLVHDSPEGRIKLLQDSGKLALLGVSLDEPTLSRSVKCTRCGHHNDGSWKYCTECGAPTAVRCAECGHYNDRAWKFCGECGASQK